MQRAVAKRILLKKDKASVISRGGRGLQAGSPVFYERIRASAGVGRVCVIRSVGGIGDILMLLPSLKQIKRDFPKVHLTFAVDMHSTANNVYYAIVKNTPFIDSVVDARYVKRGDYLATADVSAVCIRYERSDLPPMNRIDLFARALGIPRISDKVPFYKVEPHESDNANRIITPYRKQGHRTIFLHTASMEGKRCWPIEHIMSLIQLAENKAITFLVCDYNQKYKHWNTHSNVCDVSNTDLRTMAALIESSDLFVGPDSGPMHLAAAVRTKSLVLFGSIPPEARINHYPTHQAIVKSNLRCLGCFYATCKYNIKCMKEIAPDHVLREILSV